MASPDHNERGTDIVCSPEDKMDLLPFKLGYLTPDIKEKARLELNETEETVSNGIKQLREEILASEDLVCRKDDAFLLQYLRPRKFSVDSALSSIQGYFKLKIEYKNLYDKFNEEKYLSLMKTQMISFLPFRDNDACAIFLMKLSEWDPHEFDLATVTCSTTNIFLQACEDVATQVCGLRMVFDGRGFKLSHALTLTPYYLKLLAKALKNNLLPTRFKGIHFVNESALVRYAWSIVAVFLSKKINKRVHFHGTDYSTLHKFIPKQALPECYGGDNDNKEGLYQDFDSSLETYLRLMWMDIKE